MQQHFFLQEKSILTKNWNAFRVKKEKQKANKHKNKIKTLPKKKKNQQHNS